MDQNEWTFRPGQPGPYVVRTESQVSRDHVNMFVGSYPRNQLAADLFFLNADELADEEPVACFDVESYHAATSVVAFPSALD